MMNDISLMEWYVVGVLDGLHGQQKGLSGIPYSIVCGLTIEDISAYYSYNAGWWDGRNDKVMTDV